MFYGSVLEIEGASYCSRYVGPVVCFVVYRCEVNVGIGGLAHFLHSDIIPCGNGLTGVRIYIAGTAEEVFAVCSNHRRLDTAAVDTSCRSGTESEERSI